MAMTRRSLTVSAGVLVLMTACGTGSSSGGEEAGSPATGTGASTATGGAINGGNGGSGVSPSGGAISSGGTWSGGSGAVPSGGGASGSGGAAESGGTGASAGGASGSGGEETGGGGISGGVGGVEAGSGGADAGGYGGSDTGGSDTGGTDTEGTDTGGSDTGGSDSGGSDSGGSNTGGSNTGGSNTGGSDTSGSGGVTGGSGGRSGGSGGVTGGSGGTSGGSGGITGGSGGRSGGSGGVTGGSGGTSGGSGGTGGTDALAPIVPSPSGSCPTLTTGSQTIMGLVTNILAGTPQATKGPLLFTWHGTGSSGSVALNYQLPRSVRDEIVAQGGIIIAPNDNGEVRTGTSANGVWYETSDLEYADHIVACAVQNHNIDPRRIYVTGCSAGGLMAGAMSIKRSNYIAAAAPDSGGLTTTWGAALQDPTRVPSVLTMHGGTTDTVGINFGTTSANLISVVTPETAMAIDCNHQSGHCGAPTALREAAWDFMQAHPFGTRPSPYDAGLPASVPSYCAVQ